jgi:hypothetical protein
MIQAARRVKLVGMVAVALFLGSPAAAQTPKLGGVINLMQREELAVGFAIHETATIATVWPALPCFNNLVVFDQLKRVESADTVVGELAGCRRSDSTGKGVALRGSAEGSPGKLTFSGR